MNLIIAILIFSILILFHEFGHYTAAKACRVTVTEFSLGMGPRLLSHISRRSGTRYSLKLLPFGGSCQMKGEDEGDDTRGSFGESSVWQRMLIVAAGPFFNFLLAFLCSVFLIAGAGYDPPVALKVTDGYPAQEAGVEAGDEIVRLGRSRIRLYRDISNYILFHQKEMTQQKKLRMDWVHDGKKRSAYIIPKQSADGRFLIGISGTSAYRLRGGIRKTLRYSLTETGYWIRTTFGSLKMMLQGRVSADDVSGPVGIVQTISDTYEEARKDGAFYIWLNMLQIAILLSANLGVMNLLPFPALDGGRLLFLVIEAVRGRKVDPRMEGAVNYAGFMMLMALAVLVMIHDAGRLLR